MPGQMSTIDPLSSALIIADTQNDYLHPRGHLGRNGRRRISDEEIVKMREALARLIAAMRAKNRPVIWARTAFRHDFVDCAWGVGWAEAYFGADRNFLLEGDEGSLWYDGLGPEPDDIVLTRTAHSVFAGTMLDRILSNLGVGQLLLAGGPVAASVSDTARTGAALGYRVYVVGDAVFPPLASYPLGVAAQAVTTDEVLAALAEPFALPPSTTGRGAYLVIDLQNHFLFDLKIDEVGRKGKLARNGELVRKAVMLADHLRGQGWPVIWLKTGRRADRADTAMHRLREEALLAADGLLLDETWGAELADGLTPDATDLVLYKRGQSGFTFTPLHRILRNLGVTHCLLAGGAASGCLGATLREGAALGYTFEVAVDAVYPLGSEYIEVLQDYAALRTAQDILGQ